MDLNTFQRLFEEFARDYLPSEKGKEHAAMFAAERAQAQQEYAMLVEAAKRGEDVTEQSLLKLLPHNDTAGNRARGAWVSHAPAITGDVRNWFERAGWTKSEDWPKIAEAILAFVQRCVEHPGELAEACQQFNDLPYTKGLQAGFLSPILNALRPDEFVVINKKPRTLINALAGTNYGRELTTYPVMNAKAWELIDEVKEIVSTADTSGLLAVSDLLDMFSHWWFVEYQSQEDKEVEPERPSDPAEESAGFFTPETFDLLEGLHKEPTKAYYNANKDALKASVVMPVRDLLAEVAKQLPAEMQEQLETQKNITANLLKNDYGKGGAYDYYWGAFYPKGSKRTSAAQLFVVVDRESLEFGFDIGTYGKPSEARLIQNADKHAEQVIPYLPEPGTLLQTRRYDEGDGTEENFKFAIIPVDWEAWLKPTCDASFRATRSLRSAEVLQMGREALVCEIAGLFQQLYLLVLLATYDEPLPVIEAFVEGLPPLAKERGSLPGQGKETAPPPLLPLNASYSLAELAQATYLPEPLLDRWVRALNRKGQAILYGPPGTGKTYVAEGIAKHLIGGANGFVELVQFHPAYTYEDFMQGLRPQAHENGGLDYPLVEGRFLEFCQKAQGRDGICVLIIDEINRANLARVFGELMYLLEYRDRSVPLAGGGRMFSIPNNVRLIGTMNTADRSIALVDHALRRRFAFLPLYPNYDVLQQYHATSGFPVEGLINALRQLNIQIADSHYEVGISYFMRTDLKSEIEDIWRMEIEPYLEEYFFDQPKKVDLFRWEQVQKLILS